MTLIKGTRVMNGQPICYGCDGTIEPEEFVVHEEEGKFYFLHKKCEDKYYEWLDMMHKEMMK